MEQQGDHTNTLLLGVDVGTTATKAAAFSVDGCLLATGQAEYHTTHRHPNWAEQTPEDWWQATASAIKQALAQIPHGARRVAGVAVSSQAPTLVALDQAGQPVRPAIIWMDRRAQAEAQEIQALLHEGEVERISGNRVDPFYLAAKLRWFRTNEPDSFARTAMFLQANGYITYRLTSEYTLDNVHASLLQLRDRRGNWSADLCAACGVEPRQFPPVRAGHHIAGTVTAAAAEATGLAAGTPVMVGMVDGAGAVLETGAVEPGIAGEMTGTSTVLLVSHEGEVIEPAFIATEHALPGLQLLHVAMVSGGAMTEQPRLPSTTWAEPRTLEYSERHR